MKFTEIEKWSHAMDEAEDDLRNQEEREHPDLPIGDTWRDPEGRLWQMVKIGYGHPGGRWCYWRPLIGGSGIDPDKGVVVDRIFNGWNPFFAGMLRVPYDGQVSQALMLVNGEQSGNIPS